MNPTIINLDSDLLEEFTRFNQSIYPTRRNVDERVQWQIMQNPLLESSENPHILLLLGDERRIIGQFVLNPFKWHYNGQTRKGFWGADWYVLPEHRGHGNTLLKKALKENQTYFAMGLSEIAKKISFTFGLKRIGDLNKFIWFKDPFTFTRLAINVAFNTKSSSPPPEKKHAAFPPKIMLKGAEFELVEKLNEWNEDPWDGIIEYSRSLDYLKWRFFNNFRKYYFYMSTDSQEPSYFVVRRCLWRGLTVLVLVDYRLPRKNARSWDSILKATKKLTRITRCHCVVTGSSHEFFDRGLKGNLFFRVGRENIIIAYPEFDYPTDNIQTRKMVFATMADSDADLNFGDEL